MSLSVMANSCALLFPVNYSEWLKTFVDHIRSCEREDIGRQEHILMVVLSIEAEILSQAARRESEEGAEITAVNFMFRDKPHDFDNRQGRVVNFLTFIFYCI
jgi:hypothetical protein